MKRHLILLIASVAAFLPFTVLADNWDWNIVGPARVNQADTISLKSIIYNNSQSNLSSLNDLCINVEIGLLESCFFSNNNCYELDGCFNFSNLPPGRSTTTSYMQIVPAAGWIPPIRLRGITATQCAAGGIPQCITKTFTFENGIIVPVPTQTPYRLLISNQT